MEQTKRFKWKRLPLLILGLLALAVSLGKSAFYLYWFYQDNWHPVLFIEEGGKRVDVFITPQRTLDGRLVLLVKRIKGDATQIAPGDVIFEVNGEPLTRWDDPAKGMAGGVTLTVMRGGTPKQVHLHLRGARGALEFLESFGIQPYLFYIWFALGTLQLSMLGMGLLVYLKSETQPATLLLLMGIAVTLVTEITIPDLLPFAFVQTFIYWTNFTAGGFIASLLLHFFLIFPQKKKIVEKLGKGVYFIYIPSVVPIFTFCLMKVLIKFPFDDPYNIIMILYLILGFLFYGIPGILGFIALLHSHIRATSPVVKGQTRTLLFGFGVGLVVPILIFVLGMFSDFILKRPPPQWINFPIPAFLLAIPLSFGYAILRQGMLDVNFVLAKSVSYLAITLLTVGIYLGIVMGVGKGLLALTGGASQTLTIGATLLVAALFSPMQSWTRRAIDRKFYRERYDAVELLAQFSRDLPSMMERPDILDALIERFTSALQPRSLSILLLSPSGEEFTVVKMMGERPKTPSLGKDESQLVKHLQETRQPFLCYQLDAMAQSLSEADIALLRSQETVLCVPMLVQDRLVGMLNLGFKRSEVPYNREDLTLLRTVAGSAAIAVENARLSAQKAEQERMQEELSRARRIQLAILPEAPLVEGFKIASFCEPATEVGGDYYDYVPLPADGGLGFAIGDATGHGMPAALLVSMAHSCLRATVRKSASVEEVMAAMNAMVCSVGTRERYLKMTFAYSIINPHPPVHGGDPTTLPLVPPRAGGWQLQLANAGHLPPYHYVAATNSLRAIEHGAYPLGVRQIIAYSAQTVPLAPGDRLIYYSDGLIEASNEAEELYGFERFEASIRQHLTEPVEAMLKLIVADVRSYCGDVPQADDMTLVIIQLG
ncbi:SpoIIE family protein phosphatase [Candidatus Poribacteria bacterium]|nr:SpoIIE family protein phosphatase [Candidatus Poribacteria bacterium]